MSDDYYNKQARRADAAVPYLVVIGILILLAAAVEHLLWHFG